MTYDATSCGETHGGAKSRCCRIGDARQHRGLVQGVALVTVLFMLTMMATLAAVLVVAMRIEGRSASMQLESLKSQLLLNAGLDHAKTMLNVAYRAREGNADAPPLPSLLFGTPEDGTPTSSQVTKWINVRDGSGSLYGRYRVRIEDEASKLNVNSATLMDESGGSAWTMAEVNLPAALGVSPALAQPIVDYRLGRNALPGLRGDDDANNALLMGDGIDNNADGLVDEHDEGVDDPAEYRYFRPRGDDRRFGSVEEVLSLLLQARDNLPLSLQQTLMREVPRRVTIYSMDKPGSATLPNDGPADINTVTAREARNRLRSANKVMPFEGSARRLDELAANIVDYRDQNHVLSTVGSAYGVEAVCFNELLANDGSQYRLGVSYINQWYVRGQYGDGPKSRQFVVSSSSLFHEFGNWAPNTRVNPVPDVDRLYFNWNPDSWNMPREGAWDVEIESSRRVQLLGPAKGLEDGDEFELWERGYNSGLIFPPRERYERYMGYKRMANDVGTYPFRTLRGDPGFYDGRGKKAKYETPYWPVNFFKNYYISIAYCISNKFETDHRSAHDNDKNRPDGYHISVQGKRFQRAAKIESSTRDGVLTLADALDLRTDLGGTLRSTRCVLWGWNTGALATCRQKDLVTDFTVQELEPGKYYLPILCGFVDEEGESGRARRIGFAPYDRIWGDDREHRDERRQWVYGGEGDDAAYVRASRGRGCATVYVKSGSDCSLNRQNQLLSIAFLRPEVIELINVSPNPISLKNWTLTFNTGTIANDIGRITSAHGYTPRGSGEMLNPIIDGRGYFYLVNDMRLFNTEFGTGTPNEWGRNANQRIPAWEIPDISWGVQYRITGARTAADEGNRGENRWLRIYTKSERFKKDQFVGEILELYDTSNPDGRKSPAHGSRFEVAENGVNWVEVRGPTIAHFKWAADPKGDDSCDTMMLVGMPAKGGVVSMTLKNEYKQITSRTIEYDYLDREPINWYGRSVEKIDPTHYNWRVVRTPSIDGRPRSARNSSMRGSDALDVVIKNGPYNSVAEVRQVRSSRDFENIGSGRARGESLRTMSSLASVFGNSHIRLEAADEECERSGWELGAGRVQSSGPGNITAANVNWESEMWKDHWVRFLTGNLRGESFPVTANTRVSLDLRDRSSGRARMPYSSPGRKSLAPSRGDVFAIGPGFASPLCYTRQGNAEGTWTWRGKVAVPGEYDLYIFGLNDAINTTEFLEENHNSALDVAVWNYTEQRFDALAQRARYGKEDCFRAGRIRPEHVNSAGDFRLQLVAHDVSEDERPDDAKPGLTDVGRQRTGFAWFNYAVLAPVPVFGRVNVNTANERVLRSLPGVDARLADAMARGLDSDGRPTLKPYKQLGDLLNVKGMTLAAFERFVNLVMLESHTYTIAVDAQSFARGASEAEDGNVASQQHMRYIIELVKGDSGNLDTRVLEQTRL